MDIRPKFCMPAEKSRTEFWMCGFVSPALIVLHSATKWRYCPPRRYLAILHSSTWCHSWHCGILSPSPRSVSLGADAFAASAIPAAIAFAIFTIRDRAVTLLIVLGTGMPTIHTGSAFSTLHIAFLSRRLIFFSAVSRAVPATRSRVRIWTFHFVNKSDHFCQCAWLCPFTPSD